MSILSIIKLSIFLFASTSIALDAVKVPVTWSKRSVKYLPPTTSILLALPLPSTPPVPMYKRSPPLLCVPERNEYACSPNFRDDGAPAVPLLLILIIDAISKSLHQKLCSVFLRLYRFPTPTWKLLSHIAIFHHLQELQGQCRKDFQP